MKKVLEFNGKCFRKNGDTPDVDTSFEYRQHQKKDSKFPKYGLLR